MKESCVTKEKKPEWIIGESNDLYYNNHILAGRAKLIH